MKKDPLVFLKHIIDAANLIDDFSKGYNKDKFDKDLLVQSAVIRQIEIIGEAAKNLSLEFRKKHANISWVKIAGMRDKLIHLYFGVNLDLIWMVMKEDIPKLKIDVQRIIEKER